MKINETNTEWYDIEYIYTKSGSEKITYRGIKTVSSKEKAAEIVSIVYNLSKIDTDSYTLRQKELSKRLLGSNRFVRKLGDVYKYNKIKVIIDRSV